MYINENNVIKVKDKKIELARKSEKMSPDLEAAKSTALDWDKKQNNLASQFKLLPKVHDPS